MLYVLTYVKHSNSNITKSHFLSWAGWNVHTCNLSTQMERQETLFQTKQKTKHKKIISTTPCILTFFAFSFQQCQDTSQRDSQFKSLWNTWVICEFTIFCFVVLFYLRQVFTLSPGWSGIHYTRFSQNPELLFYVAKGAWS